MLKLGMVHPLPVRLIRDFAAKVDRLVVVEELDPIIENHCRAAGPDRFPARRPCPLEGEFSQNLVAAKLGGTVHTGAALDDAIPPRPPVMCAGCPHRGLFYTLAKTKCHRAGRHRLLHPGGGGPPDRHGYDPLHGRLHLRHPRLQQGPGREQSEGKTVAVIGDSTFMHSGMTGLINIAYNQCQLHRHHPGQLHHRHDRPPAEPHHRLQPQGRARRQDRLGGSCAGPWAFNGCGWWTPMT